MLREHRRPRLSGLRAASSYRAGHTRAKPAYVVALTAIADAFMHGCGIPVGRCEVLNGPATDRLRGKASIRYGVKPMADDRPHVSRALDAVNDAFHESYDRTRALEEREGAVLVVLADELVVILRDGTRRTLPLTPRLFHVTKSVAHVPVALFAAMHRAKSV